MNIKEFEEKLNDIRARNGWKIDLKCRGIWLIEIYDKETGRLLASTGLTGLSSIFLILEEFEANGKNSEIWETK